MTRLLKDRPELNLTKLENMSAEEVFQNQTLRPILKMQHEILIALCKDELMKVNPNWELMSIEKQFLFARNTLKSNQQLRNLTTGVVVGKMTDEELDLFLKSKKEFSKRINQMLIQRVLDSLKS